MLILGCRYKILLQHFISLIVGVLPEATPLLLRAVHRYQTVFGAGLSSYAHWVLPVRPLSGRTISVCTSTCSPKDGDAANNSEMEQFRR